MIMYDNILQDTVPLPSPGKVYILKQYKKINKKYSFQPFSDCFIKNGKEKLDQGQKLTYELCVWSLKKVTTQMKASPQPFLGVEKF